MKRIIACIVLLLACMVCPQAYCNEKSYLQELRDYFGDPVHIDAEEEEWPDSVEFPVLDGGVTIYHGSDMTFIICSNADGSSDLWIINNGNALSLTAQAISSYDDTAYVFYNVQAGVAVDYPAHSMAVDGMVTVTDFDRFCRILLGGLEGMEQALAEEEAERQEAAWGEWSDWSTQQVEANATTQVETKTQYRSRSVSEKSEYSAWSSWSSWSDTSAKETDLKDVESKKMYRSSTASESTQYSAWSAWSAWSTTAVTGSDLKQVETKTDTTVTYTYSYRHWRYYNTNQEKWMSTYTEYKGSSYKEGSGKWEYITVSSPLAVSGTRDGNNYYRYNGQNWYHETKNEKKVDTVSYRYRTRTQQKVTTWSTWSAWSDKAVSSTSTCKVETKTVYRYRTRTTKTNKVYGKWSEWSDTPVEENSKREVDEQTLYRYRLLQE